MEEIRKKLIEAKKNFKFFIEQGDLSKEKNVTK